MKAIIERGRLAATLARAARIVERKSPIAIIGNVKLTADGGRLQVKATDLDMEITEAIDAEVEERGTITAPAHLLADILRKMPEGCQVSLEVKATTLVARAGRSRFQLKTLDAADFPDIDAGKLTANLSLGARDLKALIDRTQFAMSSEPDRWFLNGIYLHTVARGGVEGLQTVATGGVVLAQAHLAGKALGAAGIILPRKVVLETSRLLAEAPDTVDMSLSETKVQFRIGETVLTSKLIDGTFPDYQRVVPTGNDKVATIERIDLQKAIERVAAVQDGKSRCVKFSLREGALTLSASGADVGDASEELDASYDAATIEIGFNGRFVLDILGQINGDTVEIVLADPGSPGLFRDPADPSALFVLMPMKV